MPFRPSCCLVLFLVPLAAGCVPQGPQPVRATLGGWREAVERYVMDEGNGDPNVLGDTSLPDARKGFELMGDPSVAGGSDADGLLLGHRIVAGRPWFIYLVGLLRDRALHDVRLVALTSDALAFTWRIGPAEDAVLDRYRARPAPPGGAPRAAARFPAAGDQFDLAIDGAVVRVTEHQSGAAWRLDLSPRTPPPPAQP